ncbi:MAG: ABC transporter ATP-binding protein [Candidatus Diapherotrites archaeon]|uniref:ABC transporter ATP-binding protein n=1 Tax=Candidatus Iainarchaeum sp. TaxID=3101447 RepID=A0A8T4L646_9ARCH|nr:ABC transporter ATP-binding protein [Candidatus Diapherotrites archaeon]
MPFGIRENIEPYSGRNVIEAENVVKVFKKNEPTHNPLKDFLFPSYKPFTALNGVSLKIKRGEVFGLLGPNGSGKTTFIKILTGLLQPTQGKVLIHGKPAEQNLRRIGVMFGFNMIYYRLTGYANLKYSAKLYKVKNYKQRINELARMLGLENWLYSYVENYSLGMKSKLALARALIHDPEILFLDEPTLGLDPKISLSLREDIREMDKTIIITTHNMEEANELCDRIGIIKNGSLIRVGTPAYLKKLVSENIIVNIGLAFFGNELINTLSTQPYVHNVSLSQTGVRIYLESKDYLPKLLSILGSYNTTSINEEEPTLVDVFIRLTQGEVPPARNPESDDEDTGTQMQEPI